MFKKTLNVLFGQPKLDPLVEGPMAHEYTDPVAIQAIQTSYEERFPAPVDTPWTHPWRFNPCNPPMGWAYDPYYEVWLKTTDD